MKRDPLDSANVEREQGPLMLSTTKGVLHRRAVGVQPSPPLRLARDQRVEPVGLHPSTGGLALAGRAAPLGRAALRVRPGEPPSCQEPKIGGGAYRRVDAVAAEAAALAVAIAERRLELTAGAPGARAGPGSGTPTRRCARKAARRERGSGVATGRLSLAWGVARARRSAEAVVAIAVGRAERTTEEGVFTSMVLGVRGARRWSGVRCVRRGSTGCAVVGRPAQDGRRSRGASFGTYPSIRAEARGQSRPSFSRHVFGSTGVRE